MEQQSAGFPTMEEYLLAANIFGRMGLTVPLTISEATLQVREAQKNDLEITTQDLMDSWKLARVVLPQHLIHPHRTKEMVFPYKSIETRYADLLKRKVSSRITQIMSATRDITEYERSLPIDCDITDFFTVFGHLKTHLYKANKRPKKVHKDHIRKITNAIEFERVLGYPPPVKTIPKKNAECRMHFPLIIFFNEENSTTQLDVKFKVYNRDTGTEIVKRKMKSSRSISTKMVKQLLLLK